MTEQRPLIADDYEIISFRALRELGLSKAIAKSAERSGLTRDHTAASSLAKGLIVDGTVALLSASRGGERA